MAWRSMIPNHTSTRFIHEAEVGDLFEQVGVEPFLGGDAVTGVVEVNVLPPRGDAGLHGVPAVRLGRGHRGPDRSVRWRGSVALRASEQGDRSRVVRLEL